MRIALVSDTHLADRVANFIANWGVTRDWIAATAPDLVIHLGDITVNGGGDAAELEAGRRHFDGLAAPIRFLPGNHDIGDNPMAPDAPNDHPLNPDRLADFRRLFGPDRWSFEAGCWQVIGLNAQLFGTGGPEEQAQFAWLDTTLQSHRGPLGLLLHKPLFRDGWEDAEAHIRYVPSHPRQRLLSLLAGRDLRFVACGHTHQLRRHHVDGAEHVWAPSSAFAIPDGMQERIGEKIVGTLLLELTPDGHRFSVAAPPGLRRLNLLDHPEAYPGVAALRERLGPAAEL